MNKNAAFENILNRTSVRSYTVEPVSEEDVELMLRAAMAAPSAMNRQPWEFVVIDDRALLDSLAGRLRHARMLAGAPLAIAVCARRIITLSDGTVTENMFWQQDAAAATENLLLAAQSIGLGAVWTAAFPDPVRAGAVKSALSLPEDVEALCVVSIGHPAGNDTPKDKWKPEKLHRNRW